MLENWFYDNYAFLYLCKWEFMNFKKAMEIRYLLITKFDIKNCHWETARNYNRGTSQLQRTCEKGA